MKMLSNALFCWQVYVKGFDPQGIVVALKLFRELINYELAKSSRFNNIKERRM